MTSHQQQTHYDTHLDGEKDYAKDEEAIDATVQVHETTDDDDSYKAQSKWTRRYRSTFFQMWILGILSFCGPSMSDSISALGGGGLATPYVANLGNALNYAMSTCVTLLGGLLINRFGIKLACIIGAAGFPLSGSAYYVNSKYGIQWYLLLARAIGGITSGCLYVGESTAMLSYPLPHQRGLFLAIWVSCRNLGGLVGGSVSLGRNIGNKAAGAVSLSTYLIFIAFECAGMPAAFLLTTQAKVRRADGTHVARAGSTTVKHELIMIWRHLKMRRTLLVAVPAFYSFFYGGVFSTYLALHFSVRARALSSFVTPVATIIGSFLFGMVLDTRRFSQKKRAWIGFFIVMGTSIVACVWLAYEYTWLKKTDKTFRLDYTSKRWAEAYIPFLIMQVAGYWCQSYLYWLLGAFSSDVSANARAGGLFRAFETLGQSVSYGVNSNTKNKWLPLYILFGIMAAAIPCFIGVIVTVPAEAKSFDEAEFDEDPMAEIAGPRATGADVVAVERKVGAPISGA